MSKPMLTLIELLRRGRERILRGWTQHAPARTARGTMCSASDPAAVAWCATGAAWYADDSIPDCLHDPCYQMYLEALVELRGSRRSVPGRGLRQTPERLDRRTSPDPGRGHAAVRCHDRARGRRWLTTNEHHGTANMPTTYRVVLETETQPREAAVDLDHLPAIQVDAPNVDVAARLALSHHIDSRPTPPPAGTSFGLVVITPPPYHPKVPHHDLDDEAEMYHLNVEYWPTATAVH